MSRIDRVPGRAVVALRGGGGGGGGGESQSLFTFLFFFVEVESGYEDAKAELNVEE